jgi:hypothetical protein
MAYLRVEKPRFLFLEGSAGAEATVGARRASRRLSGACRHIRSARRYLRGARRLFCRSPRGGRFRARPRRLFLRRLRGSR